MTTKERVLKLTILQRRSSSFTEEEFHAYWTTKHAPLATKWFERNNILGYTQYHTPSSTRNLAAILASAVGWDLSPYDGHVEIFLRSMEDLERAVQDPEYPDKVGPDEAKFLDQRKSTVTVGWEEVYLKDGKAINIDEQGNSLFGERIGNDN